MSFDIKGYLASFGHFRCDLKVLLNDCGAPRERHCHTIADSVTALILDEQVHFHRHLYHSSSAKSEGSMVVTRKPIT